MNNLTKIILLSALLISLGSCKKAKYEKWDLVKIKDFGGNPGNLKLYYHEPESVGEQMPMVVVLHGCTQNAKSVAKLTGWNDLADHYGFYVLYPEQKTINNVTTCFNWFNKKDFEKEDGENESIKNMVEHMVTNYPIDAQAIHVVGLSAGGLMTSILCATYPDLFQSGCVMSGGPYKAVTSVAQASKAMRGNVSKTEVEWGNLVREENHDYVGDYPKICIIHGEKDAVSNRNNGDELLKQWTNVHGLDQIPDDVVHGFNGAEDVTQFSFQDDSAKTLVMKYEISKMGHAVAVDPGNEEQQGGKKKFFSKDKDFFSTYWIADFFELIP